MGNESTQLSAKKPRTQIANSEFARDEWVECPVATRCRANQTFISFSKPRNGTNHLTTSYERTKTGQTLFVNI